MLPLTQLSHQADFPVLGSDFLHCGRKSIYIGKRVTQLGDWVIGYFDKLNDQSPNHLIIIHTGSRRHNDHCHNL